MSTISILALGKGLTLCLSCIAVLFASVVADDPPFYIESIECAIGTSGYNCPKQYLIKGGPGEVGDRVTSGTKMICTPSCIDPNSDKDCALIVVLHGIYMNGDDMIGLMLGSGEGVDTYDEAEELGGPFCMSFHKSKDAPWDYSCFQDDVAHLEAFIGYAMETRNIDPDAVFMHGFSSGAYMINILMYQGCPIERLVSAVAPYEGGADAVPTTRAAYLVPHGTHDDLVPYRRDFDYGSNINIPSCGCDTRCLCDCNDKYQYQLHGPVLAAEIAAYRGYDGDYTVEPDPDTFPGETSKLDLIDMDSTRCNEIKDACVNPLTDGLDNPFNDDYICDPLDPLDTDVFVYPITDEKAGPVILWKTSVWDHTYPNKRRGNHAAEFYFELRKFFNDNRGYQSLKRAQQSTTLVEYDTACSNPDSFFTGGDGTHQKHDVYGDISFVTEESCREQCENDQLCNEVFWLDIRPYTSPQIVQCSMMMGDSTCQSTSSLANSKRWRTEIVPTVAPTVAPINQTPTSSPAPTLRPAPTPAPTIAGDFSELCVTPEISLKSCKLAGYDESGEAMDCVGAKFEFDSLSSFDISQRRELAELYRAICCERPPPPYSSSAICGGDTELITSNFAGNNCYVTEEEQYDTNDYQNADMTQDFCINTLGGYWSPYNCDVAQEYYPSYTEDLKELFTCWWKDQCCTSSFETDSPVPAPNTEAPNTLPSAEPSTEPSVATSTEPSVATSSSEVVNYEFVHNGHCASGWMGNNVQVETVDNCAIICIEREGCGYFAYEISTTNCATYLESGGCIDDNQYGGYNAYRIITLTPVPSTALMSPQPTSLSTKVTPSPSARTTLLPTNATPSPSMISTLWPTTSTPSPSSLPTTAPTSAPTSSSPTHVPTGKPSFSPTSAPTSAPVSSFPTVGPTGKPTLTPTSDPTSAPTVSPTGKPSFSPTSAPTSAPTSSSPTSSPTVISTTTPTFQSIPCYDALFQVSYLGGGLSCATIFAYNACTVQVAQSHCPNMCNACPNYKCEDSLAPFVANGEEVKCTDLRNLSDSKIDEYCEFPQLYTTCRRTCKICDV